MTEGQAVVHIVGMGLSGLAGALHLVRNGVSVRLYEAAGHAGGRCRSFVDKTLGIEIDNGNHLLLSGNTRAMAYLDTLGARDEVKVFDRAAFPFVDLGSGERWCIDLGEGRAPWWLFDPNRRVRGVGVPAHLGAMRILLAGRGASVGDAVSAKGQLFQRFWEPMAIAVLNTRPERGSAALLRRVLVETFGRGGAHARPVIARTSLGRAFVDPAVTRLAAGGAPIQFRCPLRHLEFDGDRVARLCFDDGPAQLGARDQVILALPPSRLRQVMPELALPADSTVIANAHFRVDDDEHRNPGDGIDFIGLTNARTHWIFRRPGLISTTISAAHELGIEEIGTEALLDEIWGEVRSALGLSENARPTARRLIKEKRATFDQSPAAVRLRPQTLTAYHNLFFAGDVVDNGLPATIEGSIRNGEAAAQRCLAQVGQGGSALNRAEPQHA